MEITVDIRTLLYMKHKGLITFHYRCIKLASHVLENYHIFIWDSGNGLVGLMIPERYRLVIGDFFRHYDKYVDKY